MPSTPQLIAQIEALTAQLQVLTTEVGTAAGGSSYTGEVFGDAWRRVRLHAPDSPFGLVREWTQHAYEDLVRRRPWNFTRVNSFLNVQASTTPTVTFTAGSPIAIAAAGTFSAAVDVGMQLRLSTLTVPIYTITSVDVTGGIITLDNPYGDPLTAGVPQTCTELNLYQTMPADFGSFLLVIDPYNQRLIPWWYTQEDLARLDPIRYSTDTNPRVLVSRMLSTVPATLGQVTYEWWPGPLGAGQFPYYYRRQAQILQDTDPLLGVVNARVLEVGALSYCSAWPGTKERPNPYFNLGLHAKLSDEFDKECAKLELRDDDQAQESWTTIPYHRWATWDLTFDTRYLRSTDASIGDYRSFAF